MSSLLVTGAAGFIGSHTVEAAVSQGHRVRAIDAFNDCYDPARKRANAQAVLTAVDVRVELLDLNSADLDELLDGVDVVVHLAGQPGVRPSWTAMAVQQLLDTGIGGTESVLFGGGSQMRDFTYVGDVAKANLAAVEADCSAGYALNSSGGGSVSMKEVLATFERVPDRTLKVRREAPAASDAQQTSGATGATRRHLGWAPTVNGAEGLRRRAEAYSAT